MKVKFLWATGCVKGIGPYQQASIKETTKEGDMDYIVRKALFLT
jgi:hypothetical protein